MRVDDRLAHDPSLDDPNQVEQQPASTHLVSKWLDTLESQSSLFWLHCIGCSFEEQSDDGEDMGIRDSKDVMDDDSGVHDVFTVDKTSESDGSVDSGTAEEMDDSLRLATCNSVAHRDTELLVALKGNCRVGPVCFFCRY